MYSIGTLWSVALLLTTSVASLKVASNLEVLEWTPELIAKEDFFNGTVAILFGNNQTVYREIYNLATTTQKLADPVKRVDTSVFGSPIWRNLYPSDKTARFYGLYQASDYLIKYQISSGLSLGIFDTEYEFKKPESIATGGNLYFDFSDPSVDEDKLLQQMDTPLVSIACAFDAFYAMDNRRVAPVMGRLPASASFHEALAARDPRDPKTWLPTAPGQVLQRMGTATRADAEGVGFMKATAHHMMRRAAEKGFRRIQIECFHDAVTTVWANPPVPFKGSVAGEVNTYTLDETDENGRRRFPYRPVKQRLTKIYVTLR